MGACDGNQRYKENAAEASCEEVTARESPGGEARIKSARFRFPPSGRSIACTSPSHDLSSARRCRISPSSRWDVGWSKPVCVAWA
jgi:hypothetical protein